jgi:hypothetical protein
MAEIRRYQRRRPQRWEKRHRPGNLTHPEMDLQSVASFWAGIAGPEDTMHLGDIALLVWPLGQEEEPKVAFSTTRTHDVRLELDIEKHPETLPVVVARTVLAVFDVLVLTNGLREMAGQTLDVLADLEELCQLFTADC